ncbi:MAG: trypsin-like serine protease, partial [Planctomycetaceae bacterium]
MLNRPLVPWPVSCLAAILSLALRAAAPAIAEEPDPALEAAELDDLDAVEEDESEQEPPVPDEMPADDEEADDTDVDDADADADAADDEDAGDEEGDGEETIDIVDWDAVPMDEDEVWAVELAEDEADDAIPADLELDASGEEWIEEFTEDGDGLEDDPVEVSGGFRESEDLPVVRRVPRKATPSAGGGDDDVPYSTGGKPVRDAGAPWQAQVYYPNTAPQWSDKLANGTALWQLQHYCGGTLIATDWVLTAAHCIDEDMVKAGYRVRLGAQDISKDAGWTYKIDRIVRHSRYGTKKLPASPNMYANDIALIHIVEDVTQPPRDPARVRAIPLYGRPVPAGAEVTGTGWGKT